MIKPRRALTCSAAFLSLAAAAHADVRLVCDANLSVVNGAGYSVGPLSTIQVGDPVTLTLKIATPGSAGTGVLGGIGFSTEAPACSLQCPGGTLQPGPTGLSGLVDIDTAFETLICFQDLTTSGDAAELFLNLQSPAFQLGDLDQLVGTSVDLNGGFTQFEVGMDGGTFLEFATASVRVLPGDPPLGDPYCGPAPLNSSGQSAAIKATGSLVATDNQITLDTSGLPVGQFGIYITSPNRGLIPGSSISSNGNLCVVGTIGRFNRPGQIQLADAAGRFSLALDLTAIPQAAGTVAVVAGDTWCFQTWFRDSVGFGSNFSDAVELTFQ